MVSAGLEFALPRSRESIASHDKAAQSSRGRARCRSVRLLQSPIWRHARGW